MNHSQPADENARDLQDAGDAASSREAGGREEEALSLEDEALECQLAALEQQLAQAREEVLRTRADMDNLRKRLAREMDTARRYAGERIFAELLPVLDSLEQGLSVVSESGPAREGLELTYKQLLGVLERQSLQPIDPAGQIFDPAEHQAISMQPTDRQPENTVLTVLQKGYRLHDRILRPAMVVVAAALE